MPRVSERYDGLGVGFAPYLQPPAEGVIRWTVGEPGFDTPDKVIETAIKGLREGKTKYTRGAGSLDLCKEVANYLDDKHNLRYPPEDIIITPGAKQGLLQYNKSFFCELQAFCCTSEVLSDWKG